MKEKRPIYFKDKGFVEVPIYERDRFGSGTKIPGPCLIEETISTALIPRVCGTDRRIQEYLITEADSCIPVSFTEKAKKDKGINER